MKKIFYIFIFSVFFTIILFASDKLTVVGYVGNIEVKSGKKWVKLKIDDRISTNSTIRVKSIEDYVELLMPDNTIVRIPGGVEEKIALLIKSQPKNSKKDPAFLVVERTGVAGVRGGIGRPGPKAQNVQVKKAIVRGFVGECKILINDIWTNLTYGMELDYTNKIMISTSNYLLRLQLSDGNITNIYGPFEKTLEEFLKSEE